MFDHLGVKLVCLLVAVVLWAQVASHAEVEEVVRLPLVLAALPDSLAARQRDLPREVAVRIRGTRLQLLLNDLGADDGGRVQVDLSRAHAGVLRHEVSVLDALVSAQALAIDPPVTLTLQIERRLCRLVPVRISLAGQLPDGLTLAGPPEAVPLEVQVCGPAGLVRAVQHVNTQPLSVARRRQSFRQTQPLQRPDPDLELRPTEAEVSLAIDAIVERAFAAVPVRVLAHGDHASVVVEPPQAQVRVRGPARAVDALRPEQVTVTVHLGDRGNGVHQLAGELALPEAIGATSIEPPTFQVVVGGASAPRRAP